MERKRAHATGLAIALAGALLPTSVAYAQQGCGGGWRERHPYGDYCRGSRWGRYGAKEPVKSAQDARKRLEEFYADEDVVIGKITERELHFEAEVNDKDGDLVDRIIIDKRSGRIRSMY